MQKETNFYELDKDIPAKIWNTYLRKYRHQYKVFKDEDGIYKIKCKYGKIDIYSLKFNYLSFTGFFYSKNKKSYFSRKADQLLHGFYKLTQESDTDLSFKFLESDLPKFEDLLEIKKRNKLTEEHKQKLRMNIKKALEAKDKNEI